MLAELIFLHFFTEFAFSNFEVFANMVSRQFHLYNLLKAWYRNFASVATLMVLPWWSWRNVWNTKLFSKSRCAPWIYRLLLQIVRHQLALSLIHDHTFLSRSRRSFGVQSRSFYHLEVTTNLRERSIQLSLCYYLICVDSWLLKRIRFLLLPFLPSNKRYHVSVLVKNIFFAFLFLLFFTLQIT